MSQLQLGFKKEDAIKHRHAQNPNAVKDNLQKTNDTKLLHLRCLQFVATITVTVEGYSNQNPYLAMY